MTTDTFPKIKTHNLVMNLSSNEIRKLILDQYEILQKIASDHGESVTHIKPHGALNNMACEDLDLAITLAKAVNEIGDDIIYLLSVKPGITGLWQVEG